MKIRWIILGLLTLGGTTFIPIAGISAAVFLENQDPFCASCHTEPETTFFNRSLENPTDLASAHVPETRCIDCHSGSGIAGRAASLQQGALDLIAYASGGYENPAETSNPIGDPACIKCHAELNASHYHESDYLNEWKSRESIISGTCVRCHPAHETGGFASQHFAPPGTNIPCEQCHIALSGWVP